MKLFSELGLSAELLKAIDRLGFEQASPIQALAIPLLMTGHDIVGQSQTGSGKTAAFGAPAVEKVDAASREVQVLVLCPTRELAIQVAEEIHKLAAFKKGIHTLPIYGGQSYERQFAGLRQGAQIVIGTPGRIMDHMRRGTLRLDKVQLLVLDEADVMLDMGFREDIETILQGVPGERQTVFFSATMPRPIQELIQNYSRDPQMVRVEQAELTVPTVEQVYYEVDRRFKLELLTRLIDLHDLRLGIIFCNTKRMVDDLVDHLSAQGYSADRLHGDMSQAMRDRVMAKFRKSSLEFLVATDVAARGIDVENVQAVFNYDLPYDGEDYLHRIGRTGRAGRSGMAISFASGREIYQIRQIERFTRVKMQRGKPPTAGEVEEARAVVFLSQIREILQKGEFKSQEHLVERLLEEGFASTDVASALLQYLANLQASPPTGLERPESRMESGRDRPEREPRGHRDSHQSRFQEESRRQDRRHEQKRTEGPAPRQEAPAGHRLHPKEGGAPGKSKPSLQPSGERRPAEGTTAPVSQRQSRRTPPQHTRLFMNAGKEMGISPGDVVGTILGETGLPPSVVGTIDMRERHLFVDVAADHAKAIVSKLNRTRIRGHKLKVKEA